MSATEVLLHSLIFIILNFWYFTFIFILTTYHEELRIPDDDEAIIVTLGHHIDASAAKFAQFLILFPKYYIIDLTQKNFYWIVSHRDIDRYSADEVDDYIYTGKSIEHKVVRVQFNLLQVLINKSDTTGVRLDGSV